MGKITKILLLINVFVLLQGCISNNKNLSSNTSTSNVSDQNSYPAPIEPTLVNGVNTEYPSPLDNENISSRTPTPNYFVTQLIIPTPNIGTAIITGQLLGPGETVKPFITSIYLAPADFVIPLGSESNVQLSETPKLIATQEKTTGRFIFTNINPGEYALFIWTQNGILPLIYKDPSTILFTVKEGETKDLGFIHVP